jgi:hypothetical protein
LQIKNAQKRKKRKNAIKNQGMKNGTEKGEAEIADLLSTIRAKRDMGSFLKSQPTATGEKSEDVEQGRVETVEIKEIIEPKALNIQNTESAKNGKNTEGVSPKKQARRKPTPKPALIGDLGNLGDFLKTVQEAESQTTYTFEQNKRYYVDDNHFQTLVILKNAGRIRNVSVLINTLIGQFIETHQTDIDQIFHNKERKRSDKQNELC